MGNPALELALTGLEALGLPVTGLEFLVENLLSEGADPLTVVPQLFSTVRNFGGDPLTVLGEISSGIAIYGPQGYVQRLLHKAFDPHVQNVREIHNSKQTLIDTHKTMLACVNTQVNGLFTGSNPYTGNAASAWNENYTTVSSAASDLVDYMQQSQQIDQDFFTQVEIALIVGAAIMLVTAIILAIVMILEAVVVVAAAPETAGISLPVGVAAEGLTLVGALGILGSEAEIVLGAIIACFIIWAMRHGLLNANYHISFAFSIPTSITVFNNPTPTRGQQDAINNLLNELGPGVNAKWIQYLITMLCAGGLSLQQAIDIVRCLNARGWLQPTSGGAPWDPNYEKAWNIITGQLLPDDIQASWYDMRDIPVVDKKGKTWTKHYWKVSDGLRSLEEMLNDSKLSKGFKDALRKLIDYADGKILNNDNPDTWTDQGRSNFWKDIASNSGCLQKVTGKTTLP